MRRLPSQRFDCARHPPARTRSLSSLSLAISQARPLPATLLLVLLARSEGGFFKASMKFPADYPNMPPTLKITSDFWHPNVYPDGRVCIS